MRIYIKHIDSKENSQRVIYLKSIDFVNEAVRLYLPYYNRVEKDTAIMDFKDLGYDIDQFGCIVLPIQVFIDRVIRIES